MIYSYFIWMGTMSLILLSLEERKLFNNKLFKDKKNYFMLGLAFSMLSHIPRGVSYILFLVIITIALNISLKMLKTNKIFNGAFVWVFYGLSIINLVYFGVFAFIFFIFCIITYLIKKIMKSKKEIPYVYLMTFSFFIISLYLGLY